MSGDSDNLDGFAEIEVHAFDRWFLKNFSGDPTGVLDYQNLMMYEIGSTAWNAAINAVLSAQCNGDSIAELYVEENSHE